MLILDENKDYRVNIKLQKSIVLILDKDKG